MLFTTFLCLLALVCLAASIVFVIQDPDPIRPIALVSLCCLAFSLGTFVHSEAGKWDKRFRRLSDRSDSCQGE